MNKKENFSNLNRLEISKLKQKDAKKLILQGKRVKEINEFITKKYSCGELSWNTMAKLRKEVTKNNTIILDTPKSEEDQLRTIAKEILTIMRKNNILKITIQANDGSIEIAQSKTTYL